MEKTSTGFCWGSRAVIPLEVTVTVPICNLGFRVEFSGSFRVRSRAHNLNWYTSRSRPVSIGGSGGQGPAEMPGAG